MAPLFNNDQIKLQFPIKWESFNTPMIDPKSLFGSGPINDCKKTIGYRWYGIPRSAAYYFFETLETPKRQYLPEIGGALDDNEVDLPLGVFIEQTVMERTDLRRLLPALVVHSAVYSESKPGSHTGMSLPPELVSLNY